MAWTVERRRRQGDGGWRIVKLVWRVVLALAGEFAGDSEVAQDDVAILVPCAQNQLFVLIFRLFGDGKK
jgi:hypothetical protein